MRREEAVRTDECGRRDETTSRGRAEGKQMLLRHLSTASIGVVWAGAIAASSDL